MDVLDRYVAPAGGDRLGHADGKAGQRPDRRLGDGGEGESLSQDVGFEQVEEQKLYRVTASGVPVVLLRQGKQVYAISATCPHAGGPLGQGALHGTTLVCPWHAWEFDLDDPLILAKFPVRIDGDDIFIDVP